MAVIVVVAVKDLASNTFGRPFFVPHSSVAMRSFTDEVNRVGSDNLMNSHPDDFELWHLGLFDEERGTFSCEGVNRLSRAVDVLLPKA